MFDRNAFEMASAKVFQAAHGIDKTIAKAADAKNAWAKLACEGIAAGALTLDQVKAQLIADYRGQVLKGDEQADFDVDNAKIGDCGSTIKGWFYDLARVVEAEQTHRVIAGEALTTVRRTTKPKQEQKGKGKAPAKTTAKVKAEMPSLNAATAAIRHYVAAAKADSNLALELATNAELAAMVADIAALEQQVTASLDVAQAA